MKKRAVFFKDKKIVVHISLNNNRFYNGLIKEISHEFLIIIDNKLGEVPAFFKEIRNIDPFQTEDRK